jgi:hypothetical protein
VFEFFGGAFHCIIPYPSFDHEDIGFYALSGYSKESIDVKGKCSEYDQTCRKKTPKLPIG